MIALKDDDPDHCSMCRVRHPVVSLASWQQVARCPQPVVTCMAQQQNDARPAKLPEGLAATIAPVARSAAKSVGWIAR
jgi:hypothetical protein